MPRNNSSNRVQVENLAPPPTLRPPSPPQQPTARAQAPDQRRDLSDLATALSDLNPSITRLGFILNDQNRKDGLEEGAVATVEDPVKAREIARLGVAEATRQGLLRPGQNPYFVTSMLQASGQSEAVTRYSQTLEGLQKQLTDPLNAEDPAAVVQKSRGEFLSSLGPSFYTHQGAAQVVGQVEERFLNRVYAERTSNIEAKHIEDTSKVGRDVLSQLYGFSGNIEETERTKSNAVAVINSLYRDGAYRNHKELFIEKSLTPVAMKMAKADPKAAFDLITMVRGLDLNGNGAIFGDGGKTGLMLDDLEREITNREHQEHQRSRALSLETRADTLTAATDQIANMIQDHLESGQQLDDSAKSAMQRQLRQSMLGKSMEFTGSALSLLDERFRDAKDVRFATNPDAQASIAKLIDTGDPDAATQKNENDYHSRLISGGTYTQNRKAIEESKSFNQYTRTPEYTKGQSDVARELLGRLNPLRDEKFQSDAPEVIGLLQDSRDTFDANLRDVIQENRKKAVGASKAQFDEGMRSYVSEAFKRTKDAMQPKQQAYEKLVEKRANKTLSTKLLPTVDRAVLAAANKVTQLALNYDSLSPKDQRGFGKMKEASDLAVQKEVHMALADIKYGGRWDNSEYSNNEFTPYTPAEKDQAVSHYFQVAALRGFSSGEIIRGVTRDGERITDYEKQINPYNTTLFTNTDELERLIVQESKLRTLQTSEGYKPEEGEEPEVSLLEQLCKKVGVDPSDKDAVTYFIHAQRELLKGKR